MTDAEKFVREVYPQATLTVANIISDDFGTVTPEYWASFLTMDSGSYGIGNTPEEAWENLRSQIHKNALALFEQ